uniref:Uncharacterized protein n=1 Tax=Globodera rostochiensis TaxID=31243 RepID=A0A914HE11_GLORO
MTKQPTSVDGTNVRRRTAPASAIEHAADAGGDKNANTAEVPTTSTPCLHDNMTPRHKLDTKMNGTGTWTPSAATRSSTTETKEEEGTEIQRFALASKRQLRLIMPSTYAKRLLPPRLYRMLIYISYAFWFIIGVLIVRKTRAAVAALRYVKAHADTVSLASIEQSTQFQQLLLQIEGDRRPPALLMLNQHALNMTFNFLCNTQMFPGVHERFIFVTLDDRARDVLSRHWPNVRLFHWPTPSLYTPFSFAEGAYQTVNKF